MKGGIMAWVLDRLGFGAAPLPPPSDAEEARVRNLELLAEDFEARAEQFLTMKRLGAQGDLQQRRERP